MGRWTPLWAVGFALGVGLAALGFVVDHRALMATGILVGLAGLGGQAFLPGETTPREREEADRIVHDDPREGAREPRSSNPGTDGDPVGSSNGDPPAGERGASSSTAHVLDAPPDDPTVAETASRGTGVTRGRCGNCGAQLKLSDRRPVKAVCPNCGRSRVLEE